MRRFDWLTSLAKNNKLFLGLVILAVVTRLFFLGSSLWHNDAVDFVNSGIRIAATGDYQRSHSPDFPAWVVSLAAAEKLSYWVTGEFSPIVVPNLLAALLGIAAIIWFYFFVYNFTSKNKPVALLSSFVLMLMPAFWYYNELALSESLAIFLIVASFFFLEKYLRQGGNSCLIYAGLTFALSCLARIPNFLFLLVFATLYLSSVLTGKERKLSWRGLLAIALSLVVFPLSVNLLIYGAVNFWDWQMFFAISRRVSPSLVDLGLTLGQLTQGALPIFFFFYLVALANLFFQKNWRLLSIIFLPVLIYYYYYAGWWRNGFYDIERYLVILSPVLALGAGLGLWLSFKYLLVINKRFRLAGVFLLIILCVQLGFIAVDVTASADCLGNKILITENIFPATYCRLRNLRQKTDPRVAYFMAVDKFLPDSAAVLVASHDFAIPRFFGNHYGLGGKKYYLMQKNLLTNRQVMADLLKEEKSVYLPLYKANTDLTSEFFDYLEQQSWPKEFLIMPDNSQILKISLN